MALKRTPLFEIHRRLGAKLVEFGGWEMPLQYTSIIEEHQTVRSSVGIFDVSHMGEIEITGPQALDLVQKLITNDASTLKDYQVLYSPMCYESGGTVDDLLVYKLPDRFLLVVNAANTEKDFAWVQQNAKGFSVTVKNVSADYGQIAVQGPKAEEFLQASLDVHLRQPEAGEGVQSRRSLGYYWAMEAQVLESPVLLSRTGYTGEDGFEIYAEPRVIVTLWEELVRAGAKPIGLGARDTLRFEAGLPLYGHELDEKTTPVEAGLGWTVKEKETDYNGKEVLLAQKRQGTKKKLIGLKMLEPGVPRQGYKIFAETSPPAPPLKREGSSPFPLGKGVGGLGPYDREIGVVTSGMFAPTVNAFLAMGLVSSDTSPTALIEVEIRGQRKRAQLTKLPFYRGSVRKLG